MKNVIFLLILAGIMSSCSTDETTQLIGKWKLIERLFDPGDGSGTFQRVDSEKTIEFFNDGTLDINISFYCANGTGISGTYSIEQSIILLDCEDYESQIQFYFQNSKLILNYPTIEPLKEKYTKIE